MKSSKKVRIRIPEAAVEELAMVEQWDWSEGISLEDLLGWLNGLAARFRPDEIDEKARSSREFTPRTFRHYQTLGCIDVPERAGKRVVYGFRHYLQGLLLRKLLWERVPSDQIVTLMAGRSNEEYKRLLFDGIEIVARRNHGDTGGKGPLEAAPQSWTRITLAPGVELHLESDRPRMKAGEIDEVMDRVKARLRENG